MVGSVGIEPTTNRLIVLRFSSVIISPPFYYNLSPKVANIVYFAILSASIQYRESYILAVICIGDIQLWFNQTLPYLSTL